MIDLLDLKHANDTYGHQFGDFMLRETASLIQASVRKPDLVARYGGDEFVVLMVNTNLEQAQMVRDRIEQAFVERNRLQPDHKTMISISIGMRAADAGSIDDLVHDADMDMYAQKARQKRRILIQALVDGALEKIEQADKMAGSLCNVLYKKAPYYPAHARRVTHLALMVGRELDLPADQIETLALAALLHDIGKVSIPTEILQKTAPLTASEVQAMRHHPILGEEFFQGLEHLEPIRAIVRNHHERYDGDMTDTFPAYPDGMVGERIPLLARILKLAESIDCMLYDRPYRRGMPLEQVVELARAESGRSFDPRLVGVLLTRKNWSLNLGDPAAISRLLRFEETEAQAD
jgi:diguanylate cyclase (GGDEF)-like protein